MDSDQDGDVEPTDAVDADETDDVVESAPDADVDADTESPAVDDETPADADVDTGGAPLRQCPSPQCRYDKHDVNANFCILCGTLLFTHCADCIVNNPPYARFCYYCGSDLDELRTELADAQTDSE